MEKGWGGGNGKERSEGGRPTEQGPQEKSKEMCGKKKGNQKDKAETKEKNACSRRATLRDSWNAKNAG